MPPDATTLNTLRIAAEQVAKALLREIDPDLDEQAVDELGLSQLLSKLKNHLPERMYMHFQTVRQGGNYGSHFKSDHAAVVAGDLEPAQKAFEQILEWVDPTELEPVGSTEPPSPSSPPSVEPTRHPLVGWFGPSILVAGAVVVGGAVVLRASDVDAPLRNEAPNGAGPPAGMVRVPSGPITIGSIDPDAALRQCQRELGAAQCRPDVFERERRVRTLEVKAFDIDKYEVTVGEAAAWLNELWRAARLTVQENRVQSSGRVWALLNQEPWVSFRFDEAEGFAPAARPTYPVASLTWWAASAYCAHRGLRLPTEAEWQRAALGSEAHVSPTCAAVVFGRLDTLPCEDLPDAPSVVGSAERDRSTSGVHDLAGSLSEWTHTDFESDDPDEDPRRIVKGGSYVDTPVLLSPKRRYAAPPNLSSSSIGFRCARSL